MVALLDLSFRCLFTVNEMLMLCVSSFFIVFRMSCYYRCSVVLPHDAVGRSVVCDCYMS